MRCQLVKFWNMAVPHVNMRYQVYIMSQHKTMGSKYLINMVFLNLIGCTGCGSKTLCLIEMTTHKRGLAYKAPLWCYPCSFWVVNVFLIIFLFRDSQLHVVTRQWQNGRKVQYSKWLFFIF